MKMPSLKSVNVLREHLHQERLLSHDCRNCLRPHAKIPKLMLTLMSLNDKAIERRKSSGSDGILIVLPSRDRIIFAAIGSWTWWAHMTLRVWSAATSGAVERKPMAWAETHATRVPTTLTSLVGRRGLAVFFLKSCHFTVINFIWIQ